MEVERFDVLTRSFSTVAPRRVALSGMVAAALMPFLALGGTDAKRKKKKKKKKPATEPPACIADCAGRVCGSNGCEGTCGDCISPRICQDGACVCPGTHKLCQGQCILVSQCCGDGDCASGEACFIGTCVNLKGTCGDTANACTGDLSNCGGTSCKCGRTMENQTRCTGNAFLSEADCASDADCITAHPDIPGIFCLQGNGGGATFCPFTGKCAPPCGL